MDITRVRGDTYPIEITVLTGASPLDVSAASFILTVDPDKSPVSDVNNVFQLVGVLVDGPTGKVKFTPTNLQADNMGRFYYDIQMTDGSGAKRTISNGKFIMTQDITKV